MKQTDSRRPIFQIKNVFWVLFVVLFATGMCVLFQEWHATVQTRALIRELKNRSLNYTLQLQSASHIKELFPVVAATGNLMDVSFSPLTNTFEIVVKDVSARVCQKIIRSRYDEPAQIVVDGHLMNRKSDSCPVGSDVQMGFQYTVLGRDVPLSPLVAATETAKEIETALETATHDEISVVAKALPAVSQPVEPVQQSAVSTVVSSSEQVARKRSPLRRFTRRKPLPGETLGDVVSAENKRKALTASAVHVSNAIYAVPPKAEVHWSPVHSTAAQNIDEILAQDVASRQSPAVSFKLETPSTQKNKDGLTDYTVREASSHAGIRTLLPYSAYQRVVSDDTTYAHRSLPRY